MKQIFGDTFFYIALLNPRDRAHRDAITTARELTGQIVTTRAVLLEVGDALCAHPLRAKFVEFIQSLSEDGDTIIVDVDAQLFGRALELFHRRPDKDWPLTDCISFTVMSDMAITDALTADDHFRQAGFNPLFQ